MNWKRSGKYPSSAQREKTERISEKTGRAAVAGIRHQEVEISLQKRISVSGDWKM